MNPETPSAADRNVTGPTADPANNPVDPVAADDTRTDDGPVVDASAEDEARDDAGRVYDENKDDPDFDIDEDAERLQRDYDEGRISDRDALSGLLNLAAGNPVTQYQAERDNESNG